MGSLLKNAQEIFEVARQSFEPEDVTLHMNGTTYRITRAQGRVSVEGQFGRQSCLLQSATSQPLRIPDCPQYLLSGPAA